CLHGRDLSSQRCAFQLLKKEIFRNQPSIWQSLPHEEARRRNSVLCISGVIEVISRDDSPNITVRITNNPGSFPGEGIHYAPALCSESTPASRLRLAMTRSRREPIFTLSILPLAINSSSFVVPISPNMRRPFALDVSRGSGGQIAIFNAPPRPALDCCWP